METLESVLFVCREAQVFRIPPRTSNEGYKAANWNESLIWTGRLRVVSEKPFGDDDPQKETAEIRLEDKETGDLFASAPYDSPQAVEPVLDSSRYFVVRVVDKASGQKAYLGMGFQERTDAFDFNVALQEYTRRKNAVAAGTGDSAASSASSGPPPDFSLKEGQTFSINIGKSNKPRPKPAASSASGGLASGGGFPLIPPPPSASQVKRGL